MILVDTSVWIDHLRVRSRALTELLDSALVLMHPFVIGELALGDLGRRRKDILDSMRFLPKIAVASESEVMDLIDLHRLVSTGIGWVDAHLLASALIAGARIWTKDGRMGRVAETLDVRHPKADAP